jgi:outer membrane protein OmpA-like peptidoglycan-associated protein
MRPRHPSTGCALGLTLAAVIAPSLAHAQLIDRLSLSGHVSASAVLSDPYPGFLDVGVGAELRPTLRVWGPLHLQLLAGLQLWPVNGQLGSLTPAVGILRFGGGVRVHPELSRRYGGPFVDADLAAAVTTVPAQVSFAFGAGWLVPLGRVVQVGPAVRVGWSDVGSNPYGFGSFWYLTAGVEVALRLPRSAPPRPEAPVVATPPRAAPTATRGAPAPVVEPDPDGDGVRGAADRCPNEPETVNGFEENDGCPDNPDPDGDVLTGAADRCPNEAETRNNFEDEDGCPDNPDADSDAVLLPGDRCPNEPETRNNFEDDDGCPDTVPAVQFMGTRVVVRDAVRFEAERDRLLPESSAVLDALAAALAARPDVLRIRVEGHTDELDSARRNRTLSERRARAVARYLRDHGVDRHRLDSEGFGDERPVVATTGPVDPERNRRIEFTVVDPPQGVAAAPPAAATPATPPAAPAGDEEHGHHRRHGSGHHDRRH